MFITTQFLDPTRLAYGREWVHDECERAVMTWGATASQSSRWAMIEAVSSATGAILGLALLVLIAGTAWVLGIPLD